MQPEPQHASYWSAVVLRVGSGIVIEAVAVAACLTGIIRAENLIGISVSVSFISILCIPFWFIMKGSLEARRPTILILADRFFAMTGYTGIIYSLGGIEATYLIPIYIIFLVYYVVVSRRMLYVTATLSLVCFSLVVLLEMLGVLPHLAVNPSFHPRPANQAAILAVTAVMLYASAFTASYAAKIIERGRAELKARNAELEKAKDRALESDRLKSEFIAHMSHELRTPLHHVIGFTELVLEDSGDRLGEPQREQLADAVKSGKHLLSLINQVLDFSRVQSGRLELVRNDVDLGEMLKDSLNVVADSAQRGSVQVQLTLGDIPARVCVDERKVKEVLYNLLSNAVKFTPPGGKVVLDACAVEPSLLLVSVSDTGIGLARGDLERVFLPFESIHSEQRARYPGTGLGLSIARRYVELHGGRIWAESLGKDRGSQFLFTVPLPKPQNGG
ncbi:MAG TPA: ATP-binding protein [Spirochaetia bacterium]|nr:ATP-binding protein [Spirochaetia bacterium]